MLTTGYTLSTTTALSFDEAVERTREQLKADGFGIPYEIDVQATLALPQDLSCSGCGYGIVVLAHVPERCPMCGDSRWAAPSTRPRAPLW